jgi:hypothetical protein
VTELANENFAERLPTAREVVEGLLLALSVGSPLRKVSGIFPILSAAC